MQGQIKVTGSRTYEEMAEKAKEMLTIGQKVKVVKNNTERRSGTVVALQKNIFVVDFGMYLESFRYSQLFCQEEERVYVK